MTTQALAQFDPKQFFHTTVPTGTGTQRLDTKVSGVAISNDLAGRLSVTTAEGDKITLTADLEYDFRAVNYTSKVQTDNATLEAKAKYVESSLKREFGVTVEGDLNEQELHDLERLFRKVSTIFRKFFSGQDEQALAKTAQLAERFGNLSSLSSLDLNVDVQRSVTALAAQIASEGPAQPAIPRSQGPQPTTAPSVTLTPGEAPQAAAAIVSPSPNDTAPTQSTPAKPASDPSGVRLSAPAPETQQSQSLFQQVMDSLKETRLDTRKVEKYLPSVLQRLREDLINGLHQRQEGTVQGSEPAVNPETVPTNSHLLVAYQTVRYASISLSIHS